MKTGLDLNALAAELVRRQSAKQDYIVNSERGLEAVVTDTDVMLKIGTNGNAITVPINDHTHRQMAARLNIPAIYYDRMRAEQRGLLAQNINTWFKVNPEDRLVRVLDGKARAFLSDRYRPLENEELAEAVLPVLIARPTAQVVSAQITETRLYIKVIDQSMTRDVPKGHHMGDGTHTIFDTIAPALTISNSEVGAGSLDISAGVYTKACTNLAFFGERSMKKYHVGKSQGGLIGEDNFHLLSDETRKATDHAVWLQARDVVKNAFDQAKFDALAEKIAGSTKAKIEGDPVKVVDFTAKRFSMTDGEKTSVLRHLIQGGDLSQWGLSSAITRTAEDLGDYDRASAFERIGGTLIDLTGGEWREIAKAA